MRYSVQRLARITAGEVAGRASRNGSPRAAMASDYVNIYRSILRAHAVPQMRLAAVATSSAKAESAQVSALGSTRPSCEPAKVF
jgi:hypothetical protein